ncbi:helix-turn-helix domain-containing protein [Streptomyces sp. NPDC047043]|uniref:TetR/AcrR family transcriptional regulator n=1 Tax=Streptomyces sp. NPDC047043 TaxID=3154497 RepID=UPI00340A2D59
MTPSIVKRMRLGLADGSVGEGAVGAVDMADHAFRGGGGVVGAVATEPALVPSREAQPDVKVQPIALFIRSPYGFTVAGMTEMTHMPETTGVTEALGRRERKKAQTRKALSEAAVRLFTERGFDNVGVREVAEEADVSVTTLFKHFPSKEALIFDEDEGREASLIAAVHDRDPGQSILDALRGHIMRTRIAFRDDTMEFTALFKLVDETPSLQEYLHRMWRRHETALATAISEAIGAPAGDVRAAALARFVMESGNLVQGREDPQRALVEIFGLLAHGWSDGSN